MLPCSPAARTVEEELCGCESDDGYSWRGRGSCRIAEMRRSAPRAVCRRHLAVGKHWCVQKDRPLRGNYSMPVCSFKFWGRSAHPLKFVLCNCSDVHLNTFAPLSARITDYAVWAIQMQPAATAIDKHYMTQLRTIKTTGFREFGVVAIDCNLVR